MRTRRETLQGGIGQLTVEAIVRVRDACQVSPGRGPPVVLPALGLSHLFSFLLSASCYSKLPFEQQHSGSEERPRPSSSCSIPEGAHSSAEGWLS